MSTSRIFSVLKGDHDLSNIDPLKLIPEDFKGTGDADVMHVVFSTDYVNIEPEYFTDIAGRFFAIVEPLFQKPRSGVWATTYTKEGDAKEFFGDKYIFSRPANEPAAPPLDDLTEDKIKTLIDPKNTIEVEFCIQESDNSMVASAHYISATPANIYLMVRGLDLTKELAAKLVPADYENTFEFILSGPEASERMNRAFQMTVEYWRKLRGLE